MAEPTLDDVQRAIAMKSQPTLEDVQNAIASKSDMGFGQKAMGYAGKAVKAINSVTIAPVDSAVYAAQNGKSAWDAYANQFGNMEDEAPTGKDIMTKAGLSTQPFSQRLANSDNNFSGPMSDRMAMMQMGAGSSPAGVAGEAFDMAANPVNLAGPAFRMAGKASEVLSPLAEAASVSSKENASSIVAAAKRLGFGATPGMVSDSPTVQGLESSLSQSPSLPGAMVRRSIKPVAKGLEKAAEDLVSGSSDSNSSAFQTGNSASKGVLSNLGEQVSNIKMSYEPFNAELPKMAPSFESKAKLADQVARIGENHIDPNDVSGLVKGTTNRIVGSKNLADIEETRKMLQNKITQAYSNNDRALVDTLSKIKDKLSDFRDDQFQTLAKESYPGPEGAKLGQQMVSDYKNAMGQHADLMKDLKEVGPLFGIKAENPRDFIESFSQIPPEQISKKLFQTNNYQAIQKVQEYFPEEFESIKNMKLQDLRNSSLENPHDPHNSSVNPSKLILNINKLQAKSPEVVQILFGDKSQKLQDMQTVLGSFPEKIGPSGTPKGEMFTHMADPMQQAADVARYGAYKALGSKTAGTVSNKISSMVPKELPKVLSSVPNSAGPAASVINMNLAPRLQALPRAADGSPMGQPDVSNQVPQQNRNPSSVPQMTPSPSPSPSGVTVPPSKGPDKWANDGFQKLKSHTDQDTQKFLDKYKGAMLVDPRAKQLLMAASSFSPGSKPLDQIMKHLKNRFEKDEK